MTETLTRLLHDRADEVRFDRIDVDAIARAGSHAVRRRRWAAATSAAAVVATVALVAVVPWPTDPQPPPAAPVAATELTWASGTVLHTSTGDIDLGHEVTSYVRTSVGYVFTDGRQVYSYSYADGDVRDVGPIRNIQPVPGPPRIVGDPDGTVAAWPDGSEYVVLDQQTGEVRRVFAKPYPSLVTVDDRRVYMTGQGATYAIDVDSQVVEAVTATGRYLSPVAAEGGTLLAVDDRGGLVTSGPNGVDVLMSAAPDVASLSPDGQRAVAGFSTASGPVLTFDLRTGAITQLPLSSFTAYPYEWLDNDTVALLSLPAAGRHYELVTCTVSQPACRVVVPDLGEGRDDGGNGVGFVLPIGEPFFPYPHG